MTERGAGRPEKRDTCTVCTYIPPESVPRHANPLQPAETGVAPTPTPHNHLPPAIRPNDPPDASSLTSDCSWGGTWVEQHQRRQHTPPLLRATARGVERGCFGSTGLTRGRPPHNQDHELQGPMTMVNDTPPATSLMSNCSWGGLQVDRQRQ
jgi:hypothetical protein